MSSATHLAFRIARHAVVFCTLLGAAAGMVYAIASPGLRSVTSAMSLMLPVGALAGLIVGMVVGATCVVVAASFLESKSGNQNKSDESNE
jgi:hypothetical protein